MRARATSAVSAFESMSRHYRAMGTSMVLGQTPMPYLQGRMVGGSLPINGAICWRMPEDVHTTWLQRDPSLAEHLSWQALEARTTELEARGMSTPRTMASLGLKTFSWPAVPRPWGLRTGPFDATCMRAKVLDFAFKAVPKGTNSRSTGAFLPTQKPREPMCGRP